MGVSSLANSRLAGAVLQHVTHSRNLPISIAGAVRNLAGWLLTGSCALVKTPPTFVPAEFSQNNNVSSPVAPLTELSARNFQTMSTPLGFPNVFEKAVAIAGSMPTPSELRVLLNRNRMSELDLKFATGVTEEHFQVISEFKNLVALTLPSDANNGDPIGERALSLLANLHNLKTLNVEYCSNVTNGVLEAFSKLSQLRSLSLIGCDKITDDGMQFVEKFTELSELRMGFQTGLTDKGLRFIAPLKNLTYLKIGQNSKITGEGLEHLATNLNNLIELDLYGAPLLSTSVAHLAKFYKLAFLKVGNCDLGGKSLAVLAYLKSLKKFEAPLCPKIEKTDLIALGGIQARLY